MVVHFIMRIYGVNQKFFDLLKAFGYIEIVVKSDFLLEITYITSSINQSIKFIYQENITKIQEKKQYTKNYK